MIELHAIFKGNVQGVGFRWTIVDYAEKFQLSGTTQNLLDGSVEVYAQGSKESLEAFLESIKQDAGFAQIDSVSSAYKKPDRVYSDFRIIR